MAGAPPIEHLEKLSSHTEKHLIPFDHKRLGLPFLMRISSNPHYIRTEETLHRSFLPCDNNLFFVWATE